MILPGRSPNRVRRIGWLASGGPISYRFSLAAFRDGLRALNYVEGQNIAIEQRYAAGAYDRLGEFAAELVRLQMDVIVVDGPPAAAVRYPLDLAVMVQTELARLGFYDGPISGVIGSRSQMAIREFQEAQGLPVTGRIDQNLVRALSSGEFDHTRPKESFVTPVPSASPAAPKQESPPVALWVKGKEGQQVLSPFTGAVVDVSGFPPGSEARCPYSGKIFLVPTKP